MGTFDGTDECSTNALKAITFVNADRGRAPAKEPASVIIMDASCRQSHTTSNTVGVGDNVVDVQAHVVLWVRVSIFAGLLHDADNLGTSDEFVGATSVVGKDSDRVF